MNFAWPESEIKSHWQTEEMRMRQPNSKTRKKSTGVNVKLYINGKGRLIVSKFSCQRNHTAPVLITRIIISCNFDAIATTALITSIV